MKISIDLAGLTFRELGAFIDSARAAGIAPDTKVEILDVDELGNPTGPHTFVADLGPVRSTASPVVLGRDEVDRYVDALNAVLMREETPDHHAILSGLADRLSE